jgi:hypothetical protein
MSINFTPVRVTTDNIISTSRFTNIIQAPAWQECIRVVPTSYWEVQETKDHIVLKTSRLVANRWGKYGGGFVFRQQ